MSLILWNKVLHAHYCVRVKFESKKESIKLNMSGRSHFIYYVDGVFKGDGPSRFPMKNPQYTQYNIDLEEGKHVITVILEYADISTRLYDNELQPFLYIELQGEDNRIITPKIAYTRLGGYDESGNIRINAILGFMEWVDTSFIPEDICSIDFDDSSWETTLSDNRMFNLTFDTTEPVKNIESMLNRIGSGFLTEEFGYEKDFPQARFSLRRLKHLISPAQGIWRRYDLGTVKLIRPYITIDCPKGTTIEIAACEQLTEDGKVTPFVSLTTGQSANMIHFTARGGVETFMPITPIGGRYLELHVVCKPEEVSKVHILEEKYFWRTFFDKEKGSFESNDCMLNKIWSMGVETLRSCTEDVVTDCPVRERGQWTGDSSVVGLRTAAVAYGDLQVIRKSLLQASTLTNEDGVIPALFPGHLGYFITYSLLWVCGLMDYYDYCGDVTLLEEVYPALCGFMDFMKNSFDEKDGLLKKNGHTLDCGFVDWGYEVKSGEMIIPVICMYEMALKSYSEILDVLKVSENIKLESSNQIDIVRSKLTAEAKKKSVEELGYHSNVMLLKTEIFDEKKSKDAIEFIKAFMQDCFPFKEDAPRLYSPTIFLKQIITPYFLNFTLWALIEKGDYEFAAHVIKKCWGYMLDMGETTCLEVFDTRWSHCHQWSGCPTWILTQYGLGLTKRFYKGINHFNFSLKQGVLKNANGVIPLPCGNMVYVMWKENKYIVKPEVDITIHFPEGDEVVCKANIEREFII